VVLFAGSGRVESCAPALARRAALGRGQEVLEWNVKERRSCLGEDLVSFEEPAVNVRPAATRVGHPGADDELAVDGDRPSVAHEDPRRHGGEAVPRGQQAAGLVERGRDEAAVDEPRRRLVALVEPEPRLVLRRALLRRMRQMDSGRVVAAAPAGRVVVRRDAAQRNPPRWKCALKKFSDPAVAIAADAEISSASVAAATICAKR
jgi:hypothetical protein